MNLPSALLLQMQRSIHILRRELYIKSLKQRKLNKLTDFLNEEYVQYQYHRFVEMNTLLFFLGLFFEKITQIITNVSQSLIKAL